eukprot:gene10746-12511_t
MLSLKMLEEMQSIVMDCGSSTMRVGFARDEVPQAVFPTLVGRRRSHDIMTAKDSYVGDDAHSKRGVLRMSHPIQRGIITNFDDMELVWRASIAAVVEDIGSIGGRSVIVTDSPFSPPVNREKTVQIILESIGAQSCLVATRPALAALAWRIEAGVVVTIGEGGATVVPVIDGRVQSQAMQRLDYGGCDIEDHFKLCLSRTMSFTGSCERGLVKDMKERVCSVALNYDQVLSATPPTTMPYVLPDGHTVNIGNERFECTEALFQPSIAGLEHNGIHEMVYDAILKCDPVEVREDLLENILLTGGTCKIPGLGERLYNELKQMAPSSTPPVVQCPPDLENLAFQGAAIARTLDTFRNTIITKADYLEHGPSIIHSKSRYL